MSRTLGFASKQIFNKYLRKVSSKLIKELQQHLPAINQRLTATTSVSSSRMSMEILLTLMVIPFLKPELSPNHIKLTSVQPVTHSNHSLKELFNPNNISFNMSTRDVSSRDTNS